MPCVDSVGGDCLRLDMAIDSLPGGPYEHLEISCGYGAMREYRTNIAGKRKESANIMLPCKEALDAVHISMTSRRCTYTYRYISYLLCVNMYIFVYVCTVSIYCHVSVP